MGKAKKTRKFAQVKRIIGQRDSRLQKQTSSNPTSTSTTNPGTKATTTNDGGDDLIRAVPQQPSSLFFAYNTALTPPYQILIDTNFLSHTIRAKLELLPSLMDALYATCTPIITSCVMAELEKLGPKYRLALQIARDERWTRLACAHKGVYADDCIVDRVARHRVYVVATNDRELKRRVRKIPGVPLLSVARGKYVVERLPDAPER